MSWPSTDPTKLLSLWFAFLLQGPSILFFFSRGYSFLYTLDFISCGIKLHFGPWIDHLPGHKHFQPDITLLRACFKHTVTLGLTRGWWWFPWSQLSWWTPEASWQPFCFTFSQTPQQKVCRPFILVSPAPVQWSCVPNPKAGHVCKGAEVNQKGSQQPYLKEWFPKWKFMLWWPHLITQKIQGPVTQANKLNPTYEFDISSYIVQKKKKWSCLFFVTSLGRS